MTDRSRERRVAYSIVGVIAACLAPSLGAAQIVVGPYTFSGPEAFADAVTYDDGVCGGGSGYPSGSCVTNVLGYSPSVCNANMGLSTSCAPGSWGQLEFIDVPIVNGPGVDVVIFDTRFSVDGYAVAAESPVGSGTYTAFDTWTHLEQTATGVPGCAAQALWAVPVDLSRLGIAAGATVTRLRVGSADAGSGCQADLTMAAVLNGGSVVCTSNADCNDGNPCTTDTCAATACSYTPSGAPGCGPPVCGNGSVEAGEACDTSGESATCDADCTAVACGDGVANAAAGETCDTSGESATCDADCTAVVCGDGVANAAAGEDCDDAGESPTCDADCSAAVCGDGARNEMAGESCDDGNLAAGDGCNSSCLSESCGNSVVDEGESCDDGGESVGCDADCTDAICGDGWTNALAGEECDDAAPSVSCDADCTAPLCGDGETNTLAGEECDDGNATGGDGCSGSCLIEMADAGPPDGGAADAGTQADGGSDASTGVPGGVSGGACGCSSVGQRTPLAPFVLTFATIAIALVRRRR